MFDIFISGALTFLIDQWAKRVVRVHVPDRCIAWGPVLRIGCVTNRRDLYGRNGARAGFVVVWLASLLSVLILQRSGVWFQSRLSLVGFGLAFGGAAGNLADMWRHRGIVDFIDLHWWPVFNLADLAIVAGLLTVLWTEI